MSALFSPLSIGDLQLSNRIFVAPMCQYSGRDGMPQSWHVQHYGSLAVGGAAALTLEATAVSSEGRITHGCLGLYTDEQEAAFTKLLAYLRELGPIRIGIQIAHAGRKASCRPPWNGGQGLSADEGRWEIVAPSALAFGEARAVPRALDSEDLERLASAYVASTRRAVCAGFDYLELHLAHGYLLGSFLSPLSNRRQDEYGGPLENRMRFPLEVVSRVREAWPRGRPFGVRINAHDWVAGGMSFDETLDVCDALKAADVEFICVSAGAAVEGVRIPARPGYLASFARAVRERTGLITRVPGFLYEPRLVEDIVAKGDADCVAVGRAMLYDSKWPLHTAQALGIKLPYPPQYRLSHPDTWQGAASFNA
ncbi:NADH:flavin oxidoreductase/NADH oxidase [Aromatoleum toluclasticum]|uniref:NADH:flavin oxidoreductase/NADH oxidase n=1 Tax=Aromatoleum toluclasticum TaxID=92003 RepID=UPI00035CA5BF|nr:NADH:flavin oxidoreductase/NADH oxidase [Aromatoleum toluclasticum]